MESLLPIINKLQDVFATVGVESNSIQLPQIVVVGSQSSGKSSVLEAIVGRDFLPRGSGIVTRRPLILQLQQVNKDDASTQDKDTADLKEWGMFLHKNNKIYHDFEEIRKEIISETARIAGGNKGISDVPINLKIFSHSMVNLTLVDLPGITKVPVGDQPHDIEHQINKLIMSHISNPYSIILAVSPANTDFATSEAIKLAREVDPDGARTLAVITKLDLMDSGTDATDVLSGKVIPIKLGIIGCVNRSQQDIIDKKDIKEALKDENTFIQRKYPSLASQNGTRYLAKTLSRLLMSHIRDCLPELKERVNFMIARDQGLIDSFGKVIDDQSTLLLDILRKFTTAYKASIDGDERKIEKTKLVGGARIRSVFYGTYHNHLEEIDPLDGLTDREIRTVIENASGYRPGLFIHQRAFESLIREKIKCLRKPSFQCVKLIYEEMLRIIQHLDGAIQNDFQRFPRLYERIVAVTTSLLREQSQPTDEMVKHLIKIQLAFLNTKHPDFKGYNMAGQEKGNQFSRDSARGLHKFTGKERLPSAFDSDSDEATDKGTYQPKGKRVSREDEDCVMIRRLLLDYFSIVRKNIQDEVPKTIMYFMVRFVTKNLHNRLIGELCKPELFDELLMEADEIAHLRQEASERLKALHQANDIIGEIGETQIRVTHTNEL